MGYVLTSSTNENQPHALELWLNMINNLELEMGVSLPTDLQSYLVFMLARNMQNMSIGQDILATKLLKYSNDPINNDNYTDPLIIYFDGAFLQRKGGWAFLAVTWNGNTIFERWCAVCLDKQKSAFLGAHSLTNNTAELSAFGEALIWLICECNFPWRERGRFCVRFHLCDRRWIR